MNFISSTTEWKRKLGYITNIYYISPAGMMSSAVFLPTSVSNGDAASVAFLQRYWLKWGKKKRKSKTTLHAWECVECTVLCHGTAFMWNTVNQMSEGVLVTLASLMLWIVLGVMLCEIFQVAAPPWQWWPNLDFILNNKINETKWKYNMIWVVL